MEGESKRRKIEARNTTQHRGRAGRPKDGVGGGANMCEKRVDR